MSHLVAVQRSPQGTLVQCRVCGAQAWVATSSQLQAFEQQHAHPLQGFGDVIAAGTRALGIKPCEPCKRRQQALNRWLPNPWRR